MSPDMSSTGDPGCGSLVEVFLLLNANPTFDPTWRTGTVDGLVQRIVSDHSFGVMPILADALEEAGCSEQRILAHCRECPLHRPDCWVLTILTLDLSGLTGEAGSSREPTRPIEPSPTPVLVRRRGQRQQHLWVFPTVVVLAVVFVYFEMPMAAGTCLLIGFLWACELVMPTQR